MEDTTNWLYDLVHRVSGGDTAAEGLLLCELQPRMIRIVRRIITNQPHTSILSEQILTEASRLANQTQTAEELIAQVSWSICMSLVERLRRSPNGSSNFDDTICN